MVLTHSVLLTGASGVGKSSLIRGALMHYGSGVVVCAPGTDEMDSYQGLLDKPGYLFKGFDDPLFQPALKEFTAEGHSDMVKWLKGVYTECKADVDSGKPPRYAVLGVDTISAIGRLAYNATLAKFKLTEPPAAIGSSGAPFYSYLRITLESGVRLMRAIRGLGVHWIVAAHPTEAEATQMLQTASGSSNKIMPDLPGGFKNHLPSYFTTVLDVNIMGGGKHVVRWKGDPKRVTKSRFGPLDTTGSLELPSNPREAWLVVSNSIDKALENLLARG